MKQDHVRLQVEVLRSGIEVVDRGEHPVGKLGEHGGSPIPLGQLAQVEETFGPGSIRRESGSRRIAVEAKVHERDLGSTAREIQERVAREVSMPTGYFFDVGGRVESQARASRALTVAIAISPDVWKIYVFRKEPTGWRVAILDSSVRRVE